MALYRFVLLIKYIMFDNQGESNSQMVRMYTPVFSLMVSSALRKTTLEAAFQARVNFAQDQSSSRHAQQINKSKVLDGSSEMNE